MDRLLELSHQVSRRHSPDGMKSTCENVAKIQKGLYSALVGLRKLYVLENKFDIDFNGDDIEDYVFERRDLTDLTESELFLHNFVFNLISDVDGKIEFIRGILPEINDCLNSIQLLLSIQESDISDNQLKTIYEILVKSEVKTDSSKEDV